MNRRDFLAAAALPLAACARPYRPVPRLGSVMTVRGPISPDEMGTTLPHEHVLVDFAPVAEIGQHDYDPLEVIETVLPYLQQIREMGVHTFVEATPAYLGRDPLILRALSERSGLHIITNSGYYGAREDRHLPDFVFDENPDQIAAGWIREWEEGIGDTGIRPGFLKIGVDAGRLSDMDAALVRAACITHLESGLTIASHTGPEEGAFDQLAILDEMGVHPSAWIWVHAQAEEEGDAHVEAARRGAWVEFDGLGPGSVERHVELVLNMARQGLLGRLLVSHDAGWYSVGEPGGGEYRGYGTLFTEFLPALRAAGLSDEEIDRLVRRNPADAFRIRIRKRT